MTPAVALSEKRDEREAIKDISLKIKYFLPRTIDIALMFFTPHYRPSSLQYMLSITLRPQHTLGVEVPFVIYEDKILERGVVVICINLNNTKIESGIISHENVEDIEISLRNIARKIKRYSFLLTFSPPTIDPHFLNQGIKLGLGKMGRFLNCGFTTTNLKTPFILNTNLNENIIYLGIGENAEVHHTEIKGFIPLGKTFCFTKVDEEKNIILEINNEGALNIYRYYLEDDFEIFKRKGLFYLYPLGVKNNGNYNLVFTKKILEDESIVFLGNVEEKKEGRIMILKENILFEKLENTVKFIKNKLNPKLVIVINSLVRKNILKEKADEEMKLIKKVLSGTLIGGCYVDYSISFNENIKDFIIEEGKLNLLVWK